MKHLCFTYHMENATESAETCITLPVEDATAQAILEQGGDHTALGPKGRITVILEELAALQGYTFKFVAFVEQSRDWLQRGEEAIEQ